MSARTAGSALVVGLALTALLVALPRAAAADPPTPTPTQPTYGSTVRATSHAEPGRTSVSAEEADAVPGTGGDGLQAIEALPGVGRPAPGASQLVVWGAAPADTRVLVDGIEVPALYHAGGVRGVLASALVASIDVVPAGFGAEHGRALGGLVLVGTRALPDAGVHGAVGADLLDASALVSAALGPRLRVAVAARRGYLDRLFAAVVGPGLGELYPIPSYDDHQAVATLALRAGEAIELLVLGADDAVTIAHLASDPAATTRRRTATRFERVGLRYTRLLADDDVALEPWGGWDERHRDERFGLVPARLDVTSAVGGLRASWRHRLDARLRLAVGVDAQATAASVSRSGSLAIPAREGDRFVFGQPPGSAVADDEWSATIADLAPWVAVELRLGDFLLRPGLRAGALLVEGDRLLPRAGATPAVGFTRIEWALDPRLAASWRASSRLLVTAAAGVYHEAPAVEDLGAGSGSPTLPSARALHACAGAALRLGAGVTVEGAAYYEHLDGLATRSGAATPALGAALVPDGSGQTYGGEILVRLHRLRTRAGDLFGWVAYTIGRSERRDHPGEAARLFDGDQTHVLGAVASWALGGWSAGLRLRYATGFPRTPVASALYDARDDVYQPVFGPHNGDRLPDFVQLDARLERAFHLGAAALHLYLDVRNVTSRQSGEEVVYDARFARRDYITGPPAVAVAGARVTF